jgi:hypothetical protein
MRTPKVGDVVRINDADNYLHQKVGRVDEVYDDGTVLVMFATKHEYVSVETGETKLTDHVGVSVDDYSHLEYIDS